MASATELGGDVAAAGAAVGGLMLVYMGALSTGFGAFEPTEKRAVKGSFQRRMWFAFAGLALNTASIPFGLAAKGLDSPGALIAALALLGLGLGWLVTVAVLTAREIR